MKKDAYYFPHFCNARNDSRIIKLRRVLGIEGYGLYFMLLEVLREQAQYRFPIAGIEDLSYEWHISKEKIISVIRDFDLFTIEELDFFSSKLILYLQPYIEKSHRAIAAANKRWNNVNAFAYANALPEDCTSNASKVNKINKVNKVKEIKESKVKDISSEKRERFSVPTLENVTSYFISEKNISNIDATYRANRFLEFYETKNWYVGKNKMTNWKTAASRSLEWEDRRPSQAHGSKGHFGYNEVDEDYVMQKVMNS